ncbi:MAG: hypothetical protein K1W16_06330 [Lachnospiraceae bacterium]
MNKKMGWNFLKLAITAFGGLGIELLYAFFLEPFLFGAQMESWSNGQSIAHWILTCATWGMVSIWLIQLAKKNYSLDILSVREALQTWQWIAVLTLLAISVIIQYFDWGGLKIVMEFQHLDAIMFLFQYLYYAFETVLFMMIIVFGQKACEIWLGHEKIPYGGILCGLTWGLGHILSKGSLIIGLHGFLWGLLLGVAYLVVNKDIRKAWIVMFLIFVL